MPDILKGCETVGAGFAEPLPVFDVVVADSQGVAAIVVVVLKERCNDKGSDT